MKILAFPNLHKTAHEMHRNEDTLWVLRSTGASLVVFAYASMLVLNTHAHKPADMLRQTGESPAGVFLYGNAFIFGRRDCRFVGLFQSCRKEASTFLLPLNPGYHGYK